MTTRLTELLDSLEPLLDRALTGPGVPLPGPGGTYRVREATPRPAGSRPAPEEVAPRPAPEEVAPRPAPPQASSPGLRRDRAEEVVVGFSKPRTRAEEAAAPGTLEPAPRDGVRVISVSRDEPTRAERREHEEAVRRVPFERVVEVLAMAPGGTATAPELAAWFGVPVGPMRQLLARWEAEERLAREGESVKLREA